MYEIILVTYEILLITVTLSSLATHNRQLETDHILCFYMIDIC